MQLLDALQRCIQVTNVCVSMYVYIYTHRDRLPMACYLNLTAEVIERGAKTGVIYTS